ncbi:thioredoxin family protein [Polynucleobacter sp.]|jgi:thioredoxin 1|uniref:thioredoxin family protein n=1 Tax=Polynucleobacter sp. TaxID=2029855 RepID=UPI002734568E|nr:thioredoxin family protein [Polynucleobacter sp.]MDP3121957.1 thioredoxin family protein [Polynucleobacter sp.]
MKTLLKAMFTGILLFSSAVFAAGQPITATELADIEKQGKSAVISTHADWCSTCKKQDKVLANFMKDPDYKNVVFYQVDYDNQKDLLKALNVRSQSTIIVYKNGKEVARATGDTKEAALSKLTRQAI